MKKNENFVSKISKKAFLFLFLIGCLNCIKTSAATSCLDYSDLSGIRCQIFKKTIDIDVNYMKPYIVFWHTLFFSLLTIVLVLLFLNYKKKKKLNDKMVLYIRTVYDLRKYLDLIKKPLEEISKDDNINEAQKSKLHVAIWSTSNVQGIINQLNEQEKSDKFFQYILSSSSGRKINLKERMESHFKKMNTDTYNPDILPGKESKSEQIFMEKLITILKSNIEDSNFNIDTLSLRIGMSRSSLYHKIKTISGLAPADFIRFYRLECAKELLASHQYSISEVAYKTGFSDAKYFRILFKKQYNTNPSDFSKNQ